MPFNPLINSEMRMIAFQEIVESFGFSADEFDVSATSYTGSFGLEPSQVASTAVVRHKATGIERSYDASGGSSWLSDFQDDLANGVFNR